MRFDVAPAADIMVQPFGCTNYNREWVAPWCSGGFLHAGIDLGSSNGGWSIYRSPVITPRTGLVVAVGKEGAGDGGFSYYLGPQAVCIHAVQDGVFLLFGHLDLAQVEVGQRVVAGQQIGLMGTQGSSSAPHLHLEVRTDGPFQNVTNQGAALVDPRPFLTAAQPPAPPAPQPKPIPEEEDDEVYQRFELPPGGVTTITGLFTGPRGRRTFQVELSAVAHDGPSSLEFYLNGLDGGLLAGGADKPLAVPGGAAAARISWPPAGPLDFTVGLRNAGAHAIEGAVATIGIEEATS